MTRSPGLQNVYKPKKAVLIHSIIWNWHLPVLIGLGVWTGIYTAEEMKLPVGIAIAIMVTGVVIFGAIPAILHGIVIAWFWSCSLVAVVTVYHLAYDGVCDSIQFFIGDGGSPWGVIIIIRRYNFVVEGQLENSLRMYMKPISQQKLADSKDSQGSKRSTRKSKARHRLFCHPCSTRDQRDNVKNTKRKAYHHKRNSPDSS